MVRAERHLLSVAHFGRRRHPVCVGQPLDAGCVLLRMGIVRGDGNVDICCADLPATEPRDPGQCLQSPKWILANERILVTFKARQDV